MVFCSWHSDLIKNTMESRKDGGVWRNRLCFSGSRTSLEGGWARTDCAAGEESIQSLSLAGPGRNDRDGEGCSVKMNLWDPIPS